MRTSSSRRRAISALGHPYFHLLPQDAVVYIGHLPHGFLEEQLKSYFTQYGEVLAVKVARSKKTARSKGYAFLQFKYPEVATIVADTMNGYLLLGKVLRSHTLPPTERNPFTYSSAHAYKFINWKKLFIEGKNKPKTEEETAFLVHKLLKHEEQRREKFKDLGIQYEFPGFKQHVPAEEAPQKTEKPQKAKKAEKVVEKVAEKVAEKVVEKAVAVAEKSKSKSKNKGK